MHNCNAVAALSGKPYVSRGAISACPTGSALLGVAYPTHNVRPISCREWHGLQP